MDTRQQNFTTFYMWLHLRLSKTYAKSLYQLLLSNINSQTILLSDFDNTGTIIIRLQKIIIENQHANLFPKNLFYKERNESVANFEKIQNTEKEEEQEEEQEEDIIITKTRNKKKASADTLYRTILVCRYYIEFLGEPANILQNLSKIVATRSKNSIETDFILMLYEKQITLNIYKKLTIRLRHCQRQLKTYIQSKADKNWAKFGVTQLRPFIEVALRFYVFPLSSIRISSMKIVKKDTEMTSIKDANLIINGKNMYISHLIQDVQRKHTRKVKHLVDENIGKYITFYIDKCRGDTKDTQLFVTEKGKPWRGRNPTVVKGTREYLRAQTANILKMSPGHGYVYYSKLLWCVYKIIKHNDFLDIGFISEKLYQTGVSIATQQNTKYYNSLDQMRQYKDMLCLLEYNTLVQNDSTFLELYNVDTALNYKKIIHKSIL